MINNITYNYSTKIRRVSSRSSNSAPVAPTPLLAIWLSRSKAPFPASPILSVICAPDISFCVRGVTNRIISSIKLNAPVATCRSYLQEYLSDDSRVSYGWFGCPRVWVLVGFGWVWEDWGLMRGSDEFEEIVAFFLISFLEKTIEISRSEDSADFCGWMQNADQSEPRGFIHNFSAIIYH